MENNYQIDSEIRGAKQKELEKAVKRFEKQCYRKKDMKNNERIKELKKIVEEIIK